MGFFAALQLDVVEASLAHARPKRCVVPSKHASSHGQADDSAAVTETFARCSLNSTIIFSEGVDYNIFTPISATNLSNVEIQVQGNLHLPQNITAIQTLVNATSSKSLTWFKFAGSYIDYVGSPNVTTGWINSYGQAWWDANPVNGTGTASRPHLFNFDVTHGSMKYFKSRKPIAWGVALSGEDIAVTDTFVDAYSDGGFPFNTDGFDVSGTNIRISDTVIYNGDDAIAVGSGSSDIIFERATIGYQSHGMSIGSLGSNQASYASVSNVTFDDVTVVNAVYAARFKSWMGGQGLAKNISWKNIRVYNVTFPIFVTQSYYDQGAGTGADRPNNSSVTMEDFTWANFTGIINTFRPGDGSCVTDPCWYDVGLQNLNHTEAIIIECNTNSSCKNFVVENIQVVPESATPPTMICINATEELNPELGFDCRNGTYIPV
ncbi:pectin lyase fold/virulence factor [Talaromyces proteolyticus]|uniref:galacturonan 1,4-alpha-galacturonidase n=1 Tax=Talaromyces proteolyticus TaxID=1131652 RepID=A0AAD4Q014_9EURO|nr:pectin lyase fold/virulence factor [Talaromyces proteolyticus]KAH8703608.1 pectin lyase fold/virulence factor [Talaromyces proteolyticus]